MELFFNYIFSIMFPFGQDGWKVLSLVSIIFVFKYFNSLKKDKLVLSLFLFLIYGLFLSLFSSDIASSFEDMQIYFIGWLFPFLLGYFVIDKKHKIKLLQLYLLLFSVIISLGFLAYFNIIQDKILYLTFLVNKKLAVLCWHTVFGAKCSFVLAMLFVLFLFGTEKKKQFVIFLSIIFFSFALLLSGTRACYISTFLILLLTVSFYFFSSQKHKIVKIFYLFGIIIILAVTLYLYNPFLHERISNTNIYKDTSLIERIYTYNLGINLVKELKIFGFCPSQSIKQPGNIYNLSHFHNIYLQVFLDFGIFGFILFTYIFYNIFKRLVLLYKQTKSVYYLMLIFAWITMLISELFECTLRHPFCAGQCFWITGLILGGTNDKNT